MWSAMRLVWYCARRKSATILKLCDAWVLSASTLRWNSIYTRSEEHTSELQSRGHLVSVHAFPTRRSSDLLLDSGQFTFASASSITLSAEMNRKFLDNVERYASRLVLRPQEISNHPEIV